MNEPKPIKIETAHRAVHIDDGGLTGAALRDSIGREWIRVEDELPPIIDGGLYRCSADVLIVAHGGVQIGFLSSSGWHTVGYSFPVTVTHWMPLPSLPEVRDAD